MFGYGVVMAGFEEKASGELVSATISFFKKNIGLFKNVIKVNFLDNLADAIPSYIAHIGEVKTLTSMEKQKLSEIYFPLKIENTRGVGFSVETVDDFIDSTNNNLFVIEGTAGHGKSFFMRFMCCRELERGKYFPVFISLNKILPETSLIDYIVNEINILGFGFDKSLMMSFVKKGRIAFFFDGYDEVSPESQIYIYNQIEKIARKHKSTPVLISSRPDNGLQHTPSIHLFKLSPMQSREQMQFLRKIGLGNEGSEYLIRDFKDRSNLQKLTTTPMLLTLLWVAYKYEQEIPNDATEFYQLLLPTFLYKHDNSKLGFKRVRKCNIGNVSFKALFEAFSYKTFSKGEYSLSSLVFEGLLAEAVKLTGIPSEQLLTQDLKDDIVDVTCLMVRDGYDRYNFIHLSVQEYYTACFIADLPEKRIIDFFEDAARKKQEKSNTFRRWRVVMDFLAVMSKSLYLKYFIAPIFNNYEPLNNPLTKENALLLFNPKEGESTMVNFTFNCQISSVRLPRGRLSGLSDSIQSNIKLLITEQLSTIDLRQSELFSKNTYPDSMSHYCELTAILTHYDLWFNFLREYNASVYLLTEELRDSCEKSLIIDSEIGDLLIN
jgi:hypothetical protein